MRGGRGPGTDASKRTLVIDDGMRLLESLFRTHRRRLGLRLEALEKDSVQERLDAGD